MRSNARSQMAPHGLPELPRLPRLIDIHFHGAFGIDVMTADSKQLDLLAEKLWQAGIAGFCPTTLSVHHKELFDGVARIGQWISQHRSQNKARNTQAARPLGIHLEGPYINPKSCGAHPPNAIRPLVFDELEELWSTSQKTLKILTIAPETLSPTDLKTLVRWAKTRKIVLSLGHSQATADEASAAFNAGFQGVTHAWNAMSFHHRPPKGPGPLGAAIGRKDVYIELIIDQIHVDPTLIRWTCELHGPANVCFVSDCAPAAATSGGTAHPFGPMVVRLDQGACRTVDGALAGGGLLLPEAYARWVADEAKRLGVSRKQILKASLDSVTRAPLRALGVKISG